MPHPPRTIRYEGEIPSQTLEHFEADARGAEAHDWYAVAQTWEDGGLSVVYEHDPDRRLRLAAKAAATSRGRTLRRPRAPAANGESRLLTVVLVGLIIVALIGVAMIATSPGDSQGGVATQPGVSATHAVVAGDPRAVSGLPGASSPDPSGMARPSAGPSASPTPSPVPTAPGFKDGIWTVGEDVQPGTYRTLGPEGCYWSRLRRLTGRNRDVIVDENAAGSAIVTIKKSDVGFESARCRSWTADLSRVTESRTQFADGTFLVGVDIQPGTYRSRGKTSCAWKRLRGFTGDRGDTLDSGVDTGRRLVTIRGSDEGFSSVGCGTWTRVRR